MNFENSFTFNQNEANRFMTISIDYNPNVKFDFNETNRNCVVPISINFTNLSLIQSYSLLVSANNSQKLENSF